MVDAQVHIWRPETPDRPWTPGRTPQLPEPLGYDTLLPMMDEAGVDRVVIVPPSWEGYRNEYALEAAKKWPHRFAVMGRLRLDDPKSKEALATWKDQPGMLGIRHTFNRLQSGWLTDGTADWFWPAAAKAGIPVMTAPAARRLRAIAERNPDRVSSSTTWACRRCREAGQVPEAASPSVSFAKYPNVQVKMSSVPPKSSEGYPFRDMTVICCFDAFGPRRCFWGTDITNSRNSPTSSASPISPRNCRSSPRATRTG